MYRSDVIANLERPLAVPNRITLSVVFWLLSIHPAIACVCAEPEQPLAQHVATLIEQHEVVGIYEVVDFRRDHGRKAILKQRHSFKGNALELRADARRVFIASDCAIRLRKGDLLLIYANSNEPLRISFCSYSGTLTSRFDELQILFDITKQPSPHGSHPIQTR